MSSMMTSKSSGDCGCGCGGGSTCTCSAAVCEPECADSFCRPNFFAGQLLTEDDLQALTNYVTEKNRLHNRHFLGDGVVCGLKVKCQPCDPRKVLLEAGHAVDCCGNDIVVSCEEEIDILNLVNDLRLKKLNGYDCGNPCEGDPAEDSEESILPAQEYQLFIRYHERGTDVVTPYEIDSSCHSECIPSRICEGYAFELRCPEPKTDWFSGTVIDQFQKQHGGYKKISKYAQSVAQAFAVVRKSHLMVEHADRAIDRIRSGERSAELRDTMAELSELVKAHIENPEISVQKKMGFVSGLTKYVQQFAYVPPGDPLYGELEGLAAEAREMLPSAMATIEAQAETEENFDLPHWVENLRRHVDWLEKDELTGINREAAVFGAVNVGGGTDRGPSPTEKNFSVAASEITSKANRIVAEFGDEVRCLDFNLYGRMVDDSKDDKMIASHHISSVLRTQMASKRGTTVGLVLSALLRRFFCELALIPCPPCEDNAVLLATVTVRDCKVESICNLCRTPLLTGPMLRYEFGWLGKGIMNLIRSVCCPSPEAYAKAEIAKELRTSKESNFLESIATSSFLTSNVETFIDDMFSGLTVEKDKPGGTIIETEESTTIEVETETAKVEEAKIGKRIEKSITAATLPFVIAKLSGSPMPDVDTYWKLGSKYLETPIVKDFFAKGFEGTRGEAGDGDKTDGGTTEERIEKTEIMIAEKDKEIKSLDGKYKKLLKRVTEMEKKTE
jgi:hypothetical protein